MPLNKLEDIFKNSQHQSFKKGQILLFAGDELTHLYYLKSGFIKVYKINDEGEQRIIILHGPGYVFPVVPWSFDEPHYILKYFSEAMTDINVMRMPVGEFHSIVETDPTATRAVLKYVTKLALFNSRRLSIIENKDAGKKIANLFPYLVEVCGEEIRKGVYKLKLKITHQDIASLTGLTRETVSKEIKKLESSGVLTQDPDGIMIIDINKL